MTRGAPPGRAPPEAQPEQPEAPPEQPEQAEQAAQALVAALSSLNAESESSESNADVGFSVPVESHVRLAHRVLSAAAATADGGSDGPTAAALKHLLDAQCLASEGLKSFRALALAERLRAEAAEAELRALLPAQDAGTCAVCHEPLATGRAQLVACRHVLHASCLTHASAEAAFRELPSPCPLCRAGDAADFTVLAEGEAALPLSGAPPLLSQAQAAFGLPYGPPRRSLPLQADITDPMTLRLARLLSRTRMEAGTSR